MSRAAAMCGIRIEAQLGEVVERYRLRDQARPFTLCLCCNVALETIPKSLVVGRVPERVLALYSEFTRCSACGRIYWPGTHYERMKSVLIGGIS